MRTYSKMHSHNKILEGHSRYLSDSELLSVMIGEKPAQCLSVSQTNQEHCLPSLFDMTSDELLTIEGVGPVRAARVLAGVEFGRRAMIPQGDSRPVLNSSHAVIEYCYPQMAGFDREHFWLLALNTKNRLIRQSEISVGIVDATVVHPREVYKEAIRVSAVGVIVVHNHPSGDPAPSRADIKLTGRLEEAGEILGIALIDHVIIGGGTRGLSLRQEGYFS